MTLGALSHPIEYLQSAIEFPASSISFSTSANAELLDILEDHYPPIERVRKLDWICIHNFRVERKETDLVGATSNHLEKAICVKIAQLPCQDSRSRLVWWERVAYCCWKLCGGAEGPSDRWLCASSGSHDWLVHQFPWSKRGRRKNCKFCVMRCLPTWEILTGRTCIHELANATTRRP